MLALLLTAALIGVFVARHESRVAPGLIAVALFVTMPIVWHAASQPFPQFVLAPFLVSSLIAFDQFARSRRVRWAAVSGAVLSAMIYFHLAGVVLALSVGAVLVAALAIERAWTAVIALAAGLIVAALPWAVMTLLEPEPVRAAIAQHGLYDAHRFNVLQGAREMTTWLGFTVRSEVYWDSFNPAFLFLGKGGLVESVLHPRMFWLPLAIPLAIGIVRCLQTPTLMTMVLVGVFLVSPCVVAILGQPPDPGRLTAMAPIAAIIAALAFSPRERSLPPASR